MSDLISRKALLEAFKWFNHSNEVENIYYLITNAPAMEQGEPVAEALHERNRLGYAVVDVIGTLDEIIENAQEVEVDDFLHIAIPIDKWHELQDALEEMPKRAELYTSPISKEWVWLSDEAIKGLPQPNYDITTAQYVKLIEAKLKELNT